MDVLKDPESSFSKQLQTHKMPFNNSTAMNSMEDISTSVKIDLRVPLLVKTLEDMEEEAGLVVVDTAVEDTVVVDIVGVDMEEVDMVEADLKEDMEEVDLEVEDMVEEDIMKVDMVEELPNNIMHPLLQMNLPILLQPVVSLLLQYLSRMYIPFLWNWLIWQLPWSTSNQDLMELFITIGKVDRAEIGFEPSGRSRGIGVVQFDSVETADSAIQKFQGYMYGGRYSPSILFLQN